MSTEDGVGALPDVEGTFACAVEPVCDLAGDLVGSDRGSLVLGDHGEVELRGDLAWGNGVGEFRGGAGSSEVSGGKGVGGEQVCDVDDADE